MPAVVAVSGRGRLRVRRPEGRGGARGEAGGAFRCSRLGGGGRGALGWGRWCSLWDGLGGVWGGEEEREGSWEEEREGSWKEEREGSWEEGGIRWEGKGGRDVQSRLRSSRRECFGGWSCSERLWTLGGCLGWRGRMSLFLVRREDWGGKRVEWRAVGRCYVWVLTFAHRVVEGMVVVVWDG